jgi:hypothetical protein
MATEHRLRKGYLLVMLLFSEYPRVRCQVVPIIEFAGCFGQHKCIDLRQTLVNTLFYFGGNKYTSLIVVLFLFLGTQIEKAKKRSTVGKRGH